MVFLSLGSNLYSKFGNRFTNLEKAIKLIESHNIQVIKKSSFYETPFYPSFKNPKFINIAICINTSIPPVKLMKIIFNIEETLGRIRKFKNEPRTCDIDIIDYDKKILGYKKGNNLILPHPRMDKRNFVLYPLREIEPK